MKIRLLAIFTATLLFTACPAEKDARNAAAALQGSLLAAQAKYQASCTAAPALQICHIINQGVSAQNALITATQAYCGWSAAAPPPKGTKCLPVKSAEAAFTAALANARQLTGEINGAIK